MIGVPMNPNSIHVSMVQTGCCKGEFDSTYPIHLNGIIGQDEFRESIDKINRTISSTGAMMFVAITFVLGIVGGMIFFIAGGITATNSHMDGFPPLIGVGMGLFICGSMIFIFGLVTIQFRRAARMRQAITEESMKYSSRSPTPCSWRLETTRHYYEGYGNNNTQLLSHIVIDIGRSFASGSGAFYSNQGNNESTFLVGQQNNYAPPPYSNQSTGFCSKCSAPRQDLSAKFCSSCGQAFNKY